MSEPGTQRRRRGRGIDGIFDSTDLDLGPAGPSEPRRSVDGGAADATAGRQRRGEPEAQGRNEVPDARARGHGGDAPGDGLEGAAGQMPAVRDPHRDAGRDSGWVPGGDTVARRERREARRSRGRPPSERPPGRELVQRGFYLEVEQDRTLDETKAALKTRGFTPDRSAIVRAALEHFARLDRVDQEDLVRREK